MWSDSVFDPSHPDPAKLEKLALACAATYSPDPSVFLSTLGDNIQCIIFDADIAAYTVTIDAERLMVIQGTTSAEQYVAQADGYVTAVDYFTSGKVNSYAATIVENEWAKVPNDISLFVGHSLGGAIAILLGRKSKLAGLPVAGSVTFGAPKVFTLPAAANTGWQPIVNIINPLDPVPLTPPDPTAGETWKLPGDYWIPSGGSLFDTTPPSLSPLEYLIFLQQHGVGDHSIGKYAGNLFTLSPPPIAALGGPMPDPSVFRVEVKGVLFGQRCDNGFWYTDEVLGAGTSSQLIDDFRAEWRASILPRVTSQYSVYGYTVKKLDSVVFEDPLALKKKNLLRFSDLQIKTGSTDDVGQASLPDSFPSFVAVGLSKGLAGYELPDQVTPVVGAKLPRGSCRISGIPRLHTRATADGDELLAPILDSWIAAAEKIRQINQAGHRWGMRVLAESGEGGAAIIDVANNPSYRIAHVNSLAPSKYLTSQVSRKQSLNTLG